MPKPDYDTKIAELERKRDIARVYESIGNAIAGLRLAKREKDLDALRTHAKSIADNADLLDVLTGAAGKEERG